MSQHHTYLMLMTVFQNYCAMLLYFLPCKSNIWHDAIVKVKIQNREIFSICPICQTLYSRCCPAPLHRQIMLPACLRIVHCKYLDQNAQIFVLLLLLLGILYLLQKCTVLPHNFKAPDGCCCSFTKYGTGTILCDAWNSKACGRTTGTSYSTAPSFCHGRSLFQDGPNCHPSDPIHDTLQR